MHLKNNIRLSSVIKYAGAYIAFEIGSGFATGQEILQFYTSYGAMGIGAALISMIIFAWAGGSMMKIGYCAAEYETAKPYRLLCGKPAGLFFEWFVIFYLFAVLAVMLSGAGAALQEYCGFSYYAGGLFMALAVFSSFVFGLSKLIRIVGLMGPFIIGFCIFIAICTITANFSDFLKGTIDFSHLEDTQPAGRWWLSGILYAAYNMVSSAGFLMALGKDARSAKEAAAGGIMGGVLLSVTVIFMNLAMMSGLPRGEKQAVPSLVLAENVSPFASGIFIFVLLCGVFSTAAPVLWTICTGLSDAGSRASVIIAFFVTLDAFLLGQLPFDKLIAVIYPFAGYLGIFLLLCLLRYQMKNRRRQ